MIDPIHQVRYLVAKLWPHLLPRFQEALAQDLVRIYYTQKPK